jgi:hypothetical protein
MAIKAIAETPVNTGGVAHRMTLLLHADFRIQGSRSSKGFTCPDRLFGGRDVSIVLMND